MYSFKIWGHKNILATHKTTFEFTKDEELSKNGDCIVGVRSTFDMKELKKFSVKKKITITIKTDDITETITAKPNPDFSDDKEMVIRLGSFVSPRTFAYDADKSSKQINRRMISELSDGIEATVEIE